jgi:predicted phosphate transport protein (TIGR00153 family)
MKLKKEKFNYFDTLVQMSNYALEEAKLLHESLSNYDPEQLDDLRKKMHELEHACDCVKHALTTALIKDFLPPIDREDLFTLSHITDNLTDTVESIVTFFYMADIRTLRDDTAEFTALMVACCENTVKMLQEFHNFKKPTELQKYIILLNDLEEQGDRLYEESVRRLSREEGASPREVIEWRDVYRNFENCFDAAESIADNIESIVLKNS